MIDLKLEEDAHSPTKPRGETLITFDIKNTETLKKEDCVVSILNHFNFEFICTISGLIILFHHSYYTQWLHF